MKNTVPSRHASPSADSLLDSQLGRYALAATAALAVATQADAAVTNLYTTGGTLSLSGDTDTDTFTFSEAGFSLRFDGYRSTGPVAGAFAVGELGIQIDVNSDSFAAKLSLDDPISGFNTVGNYAQILETNNGFLNTSGAFGPNVNDTIVGYLGFRADIGGTPHLGWLRISVARVAGRPSALTIVPGVNGITGAIAPESEGLLAGETAIPEPATAATGLSLLALGAAGLRRRRALRAAA